MQRSFGLLSMVTAIFIVSTTNATVYFVDHDVIVSGDGSSWPNAYKTLQEALDEADGSDGADIINIADGTYKPSTPSGHGATFLMEPSVSIIGGWAGVSNESPNREFITILSGDLNGDDGANFANRSDNAYHVVSAINVLLGNTVILDGVTIKGGIGGSLTTPLDTDYGGGIWLLDAESPRITNCIITENMAVFGAGAYVEGSTPIFRGCKFVANRVSALLGSGGGVLVDGCEPILVQCDFVRNEVTRNGGGVQVRGGGSPRIFNCLFLGNRCDHVGGGLSMRGNDTDVPIIVVNCAFVGNYAQDSGGGCRVGSSSRCDFFQCTFVENFCSDHGDVDHQGSGGGLSLGRDTEAPAARVTNIDNCIFWNNRIYDEDAHGSQIALIGVYPGTATIEHCDIQDSDTSEPGVYVKSGWTAPTHTAWIDAEPDFLIDPAPGTGGWGHSDDDYGDLRVNAGSPVISNGDCALVPNDLGDVDNSGTSGEVLPLDLRLEERRWSGVDMGAYERQTLCYANIAGGDSAVGVADLLAVISNWGPCAAFPASCPVDFTPLRCADHAVGVAELLAVINTWGECLGEPNTDAPTTVAECMTFCGNQFGFGTPEYQSCLEKCCSTLDE